MYFFCFIFIRFETREWYTIDDFHSPPINLFENRLIASRNFFLLSSVLSFVVTINTNTTIKFNLLRKTISWRLAKSELQRIALIYTNSYEMICKWWKFGNSCCVQHNRFTTSDAKSIGEKRKIQKKFRKRNAPNCDAGNWNFGGRRVCIFTQISLRKFMKSKFDIRQMAQLPHAPEHHHTWAMFIEHRFWLAGCQRSLHYYNDNERV